MQNSTQKELRGAWGQIVESPRTETPGYCLPVRQLAGAMNLGHSQAEVTGGMTMVVAIPPVDPARCGA